MIDLLVAGIQHWALLLTVWKLTQPGDYLSTLKDICRSNCTLETNVHQIQESTLDGPRERDSNRCQDQREITGSSKYSCPAARRWKDPYLTFILLSRKPTGIPWRTCLFTLNIVSCMLMTILYIYSPKFPHSILLICIKLDRVRKIPKK